MPVSNLGNWPYHTNVIEGIQASVGGLGKMIFNWSRYHWASKTLSHKTSPGQVPYLKINRLLTAQSQKSYNCIFYTLSLLHIDSMQFCRTMIFEKEKMTCLVLRSRIFFNWKNISDFYGTLVE